MQVGAVSGVAQGAVSPVATQAQQPAAAANSRNLQPGNSLVFKAVDESHKSSKANNRHDPDDRANDMEESEWLQKKYKREKRLGLNVDKYI